MSEGTKKNEKITADVRTVRNKVNSIIRLSKRKFYANQFCDSRYSVGKAWSLVDQLRGNQRSSVKDSIERNFGSTSLSLADAFNNHFST